MTETIGIAERTVQYHLAEILERPHLDNRAQAIVYVTRAGLAEKALRRDGAAMA